LQLTGYFHKRNTMHGTANVKFTPVILLAVSTHPRHQPAATWVNTTKSCKYSQVLLMMSENVARNM